MNEIKDGCIDVVVDLQFASNLRLGKGETDCMGMYNAFYEQHKQKHGSFKGLKGEDYHKAMESRYNYICCMINEVIESKAEYIDAIRYAQKMGCL